MTAVELLAIFIFAHYVADYPMQGQFIALGKNRSNPLEATPWYQVLTAHAVMHGGLSGAAVVAAGVAGSPSLLALALPIGIAEAVCHWLIDDWKCRHEARARAAHGGAELERRRLVAYNLDQTFHVICKLAWTSVCAATAGLPLFIQ